MRTDELLHPYHIIPTSELISAFVKFSDLCESEMFVEFGAVFCQIFVLRRGISDAGVQVENPHFFQFLLQGLIQHTPQPALPLIPVDINGGLTGPVIGRPVLEDTGVGIAFDPSVLFNYQKDRLMVFTILVLNASNDGVSYPNVMAVFFT